MFAALFSIFLLLYGLINYYIGLRIWQSFGSHTGFLNPVAYGIVFGIISASYLLGRAVARFMPRAVTDTFDIIGSYWLGILYYALLLLAVIDIGLVLGRAVRLLPTGTSKLVWNHPVTGVAVILIISGIMAYGVINARTLRVIPYDIAVDKGPANMGELRIAMVSDIHLGIIVDRKRLAGIVDKLNSLEPDLILIAGDVIDDDISPYKRQAMGEEFKRLKARYGTFACLGNHDYYGGYADELTGQLTAAGVTVLRDGCTKVVDMLYIAGREDKAVGRGQGSQRKALAEILKDRDESLPVILLDHQPIDYAEALASGVDLQISGHTHQGQLFPNQLITGRVYELDWGYMRKGSLQAITTSGVGTWGPPIRTGSASEIVEIKLRHE